MIFKICPAEAGNEKLVFRLKVEGNSAFLLPVLKCVLCGSEEEILEYDTDTNEVSNGES